MGVSFGGEGGVCVRTPHADITWKSHVTSLQQGYAILPRRGPAGAVQCSETDSAALGFTLWF